MSTHGYQQPGHPPAHIDALQSLRGIFAVFIFFHYLDVFPAGGDVGVVFFFMLSGFVMTYGYGARVLEEGFNRQRYLKRRVARVWPLHLVCLLAALTLLPVTLNADTVAALGLNIVLLQSWVPLRDFFFSGNSVSWCLCDLMFFYILFPWLRRLFHRLKGRLIAVLTAAAAALYVAVAVIVPADFRLGVVYVNPLMRLPDFLIGMGLCMLLLHHRQRLPRMSESAATAAQAGVWLLLGLFIALWPFVPPTVQYASLLWIPCGALLMATACGGGPLTRLLKWRPLVRAGELSFSFYMIHQLVIRVMRRALYHWQLEWSTSLCIVVALTATIFATWVLHRLVEVPARRFLLRERP